MTPLPPVLLVSFRYHPEVSSSDPIGGGPISVREQARALVEAGADVRVVSFVRGRPRSDELLDGVRLTRLPIRRLPGAGPLAERQWLFHEMTRGLGAVLEEFRPGLVHAFGSRAVPGVARAARRRRLPYVATVNEPHLLCATSIGRDRAGRDCLGCGGVRRLRAILGWRGGPSLGGKARAVLFWLYSYPHMAQLARSARRASALLPISRGLARDLVRLGFPPDRVRVVPNPVRVPAEIPESARPALGIPQDARVLMYAGRLVEEKGVQNVIRAMPTLPNTTLLVIGRGRHEAALRADATALGLGARVRFLGAIANEALGPYYATADVVVMAGVFYEALGRMLMEASAHGVPVVGTNVGGVPDVIEDGRNGFLLESQEREELCGRIRAILDSPGRARQMGAYGRAKMARDFSPARTSAALLAAYRFALAGASAGAAAEPAPASVSSRPR